MIKNIWWKTYNYNRWKHKWMKYHNWKIQGMCVPDKEMMVFFLSIFMRKKKMWKNMVWCQKRCVDITYIILTLIKIHITVVYQNITLPHNITSRHENCDSRRNFNNYQPINICTQILLVGWYLFHYNNTLKLQSQNQTLTNKPTKPSATESAYFSTAGTASPNPH